MFSSLFLDIVSNTTIIYLGVLAGFIFIKSPLKKYRKLFINLTINYVTSVLIFVSFVKIKELGGNLWFLPIIASFLVTIIGIIYPKLHTHIFSKETPKPAELCTSSFPNALNFPFPIIFALTPEGLGAAGIFLGTSIILRNTVGLWLSGVKFNRAELGNIVKFPPFWGIILGIPSRIFMHSTLLPVIQLPIVDFIFQVGIFMTLMTIGFSLQKPSLKYIEPYIRVGLSRYVISLIFAILIIFVSLPPVYISVPILVQMVAPPAVYNSIYAEKFGLDTELTSQVIIFLTLIALIILPVEMVIISTVIL